ncbi:MAG: tudor domain-containing protein [Pseudomonadales bacterium]|nr:tudor domain-containing protein [Pseudomonadales bacterium]NRA16658.1 hypothetical protein [Oceanospirillaceae bacterium]
MKTDSMTFSRFLKAIAIICALSYTLPALALSSWSKGDRVFGLAGNGKWYPGRITGSYSTYYKVKYDINNSSVNAKKVAQYTWETGSKLQCTIKGAGNTYFRGKILSTHEYNIFQIKFDRGNVQYRRSSDCIYDGTPYIPAPKITQQYSPPPPGGSSHKFNAGDAILAYHTGYWYPATITAVRVRDYAIKFNGGLESNYNESHLSRMVWRQGSRILCKSKTDSTNKKYYTATVEAINNSDIWVIYSNNARESMVHGKCRSK